jgi:hypothetical protein
VSPASASTTARWCGPTRSSANPDLPVAYKSLLGGMDAPRVARAATTRRRAWSGTQGCEAPCRPRRRTTTSTSARRGTTRSAHCWRTGCACRTPRSSSPATPRTTRAWPRGLQHALRPRADAEPRRAHRLDRRARAGAGVADRPRRRARVPGRRRGRGLRRPARLGARRDGAGTPFALSHRFRQTGPFRPSNVDKRRPASCSSARARSRASACRWCSSPGDSQPSASAG